MPCLNCRFLFYHLTKEFITISSAVMVFLAREFLFELFLPLFIFICVMLTMFCNWSWVPISPFERKRGKGLEEMKKSLLNDLD